MVVKLVANCRVVNVGIPVTGMLTFEDCPPNPPDFGYAGTGSILHPSKEFARSEKKNSACLGKIKVNGCIEQFKKRLRQCKDARGGHFEL